MAPSRNHRARLEYAEHRRNEILVFARRAFFSLVVVSALLAAWRWAPPIAERLRLLREQRACMHYVAPTGQAVYEEGPDPVPTRKPTDAALEKGEYGGWFRTRIWPKQWPPIFQVSTGTPIVPEITRWPQLFLGELRLGHLRRLVWVGWEPSQGRSLTYFNTPAVVVVITPGTLWALPRGELEQSVPVENATSQNLSRGQEHFRFFGGTRDSSDPSRFRIPYEKDGVLGAIDGWLTKQGNVRLRFHDGPGAARQ
jgi:hypothetical protein